MNIAKLGRIVGANGKQSQFRGKAPPDFAEAGKVRGVSGVIDRVLAGFEYEASVAAMRIFQDAGTPMPRRDVRDLHISVARILPPVQLDNFRESQVGDQIRNMCRNDDGGRDAARAQSVLHDGAKRRPVEMIKMCMRYQHEIDRRKIDNAEARTPQPLQNKQPPREVGIDNHASAADLHEEAGMSDEGNAEFSISGEPGFMCLAAATSDRRMPHQARKLRGTLAKGRIAKCLFDHPAAGSTLKLKLQGCFMLVPTGMHSE